MRWSWLGLLGNIKNKTWRKIWPVISFVAIIGAVVLAIFQITEYVTFTSDIDEIDFTFEYPRRSWDEPSISQSANKYSLYIQGAFDISVSVYLNASSQPLADAEAIIDEYIYKYSNYQKFNLKTSSILTLGLYTGPRVVFNYDAVDESVNNDGYIHSQTLIWVFPYNGELYEILISGSREVLNDKWEEQARFIESFMILD